MKCSAWIWSLNPQKSLFERDEMLGRLRIYDDLLFLGQYDAINAYMDLEAQERVRLLEFNPLSSPLIGGDASNLYLDWEEGVYRIDLETEEAVLIFEEDEDALDNEFLCYDDFFYHLQLEDTDDGTLYTIKQLDENGRVLNTVYEEALGQASSSLFYLAEPGTLFDEAVFLYTVQIGSITDDDTQYGVIAVDLSGERLDDWLLTGYSYRDIYGVTEDGKFVCSVYDRNDFNTYIMIIDTVARGYTMFYDEDRLFYMIGGVSESEDGVSFYFRDGNGIGYTANGEEIDSYVIEDGNIGLIEYGTDRIYYIESKKSYLQAIGYNGENQEEVVSSKVLVLGIVGDKLYYADVHDRASFYSLDMQTGEINKEVDGDWLYMIEEE